MRDDATRGGVPYPRSVALDVDFLTSQNPELSISPIYPLPGFHVQSRLLTTTNHRSYTLLHLRPSINMAELEELPAENSSNGIIESTLNDPESKARLDHFTAEATAKYAIKDYDVAAELYSQATELQARINGEMSPRNADLLYAYGKCLYHLALRNSDVLGPRVAGEAQAEESKASSSKKQSNQSKSAGPAAGPAAGATSSNGHDERNNGKDEDSSLAGKKPLFQFTGDENFDDSDEDEMASGGADGKDGGEAEEDPEDDFANAYEVLDLARILLLKRIEELRDQEEGAVEGRGKGEASKNSEAMQQLKERLADTHDLQAEIFLEGERFPAAVTDLKAALDLKKELFPESSSLIAEAHYKLSLALEFSSVTRQKDPSEGGENEDNQVQQLDLTMREEAANEMEAAIQSCKLRIQVELARLNGRGENKEVDQHAGKKVTKVDIDDVKEMVEEMEQRVYTPSPPLPFSYPLHP